MNNPVMRIGKPENKLLMWQDIVNLAEVLPPLANFDIISIRGHDDPAFNLST